MEDIGLMRIILVTMDNSLESFIHMAWDILIVCIYIYTYIHM